MLPFYCNANAQLCGIDSHSGRCARYEIETEEERQQEVTRFYAAREPEERYFHGNILLNQN